MFTNGEFDPTQFDPATAKTLKECFQDVWNNLNPAKRDRNPVIARQAIAEALIGMAEAGQRDPERLRTYANSRATRALDGL